MTPKDKTSDTSGTTTSPEPKILERGLPLVKVDVKLPVIKPPKDAK